MKLRVTLESIFAASAILVIGWQAGTIANALSSTIARAVARQVLS